MWYLVFYFFIIFNFNSQIYGFRESFTSPTDFSMGGAGFLFSSFNSQIKNPANHNKNRIFTTSIVKYPAGINSQSLGFNLPLNNSFFSSSLNYLSYGVFEGYNEYADFTGVYKSYETMAEVCLSKKIKNYPMFVGSSLSGQSSNFDNLKIHSLYSSLGCIWYFKNINNAIGVSINQLGLGMVNGKIFYKAPEFVLSGSKKLNYLPNVIYVDLLFGEKNKKEVFMGTFLNFNKSLKFMIGTSSRKIDQNTSQDLLKSILGATGFGFVYDTNQVMIQYGIYYYGVGLGISGLNISVNF